MNVPNTLSCNKYNQRDSKTSFQNLIWLIRFPWEVIGIHRGNSIWYDCSLVNNTLSDIFIMVMQTSSRNSDLLTNFDGIYYNTDRFLYIPQTFKTVLISVTCLHRHQTAPRTPDGQTCFLADKIWRWNIQKLVAFILIFILFELDLDHVNCEKKV